MSQYYKLLDEPYEGEFNSDPYDFGFELDNFQKHAISCIKKMKMCWLQHILVVEKQFQQYLE